MVSYILKEKIIVEEINRTAHWLTPQGEVSHGRSRYDPITHQPAGRDNGHHVYPVLILFKHPDAHDPPNRVCRYDQQRQGASYTTNYTYSSGGFDYPAREFRGFGYAKASQMRNTQNYEAQTETWFHQDFTRKDMTQEVLTTSREGHTRRVDNTRIAATLVTGVTCPRLDLTQSTVTTYLYYSEGNVSSATDPRGNTTSFTYDTATKTFVNTATSALDHITTKTYNPGTGKPLTLIPLYLQGTAYNAFPEFSRYEAAAKYNVERVQFGKPIIKLQAVGFMQADMAIRPPW